MAKQHEDDPGDGVDDLNNMLRGVLEDASCEEDCGQAMLYACVERLRHDCDAEVHFKRLARKVTTTLKCITPETPREKMVTTLLKVWIICDGEPGALSFDDDAAIDAALETST